jgi:hypothetical protein
VKSIVTSFGGLEIGIILPRTSPARLKCQSKRSRSTHAHFDFEGLVGIIDRIGERTGAILNGGVAVSVIADGEIQTVFDIGIRRLVEETNNKGVFTDMPVLMSESRTRCED